MRVPLQESESLKLEFKRAEVLNDTANVAREAVAMLNASGGQIWIGLVEKDSVAIEAQRIPDAPAARVRLRDALLNRIEPTPQAGEVEVEVHDGLLVVTTARGKRGPYAYREAGLRGFVRRMDSRVQIMELGELREAFRGAGAAAATPAVVEKLEALRRAHRDLGDGIASQSLAIWLAPEDPLELDLKSPRLEEYLRDPRLAGNRPRGWNPSSAFHQLEVGPRVRYWKASHPSHQLGITREGGLTFTVPLDRLNNTKEANALSPLALAEYLVSVFRLYARLVPELVVGPLPQHVWAALSMRGARDWGLRPGSPSGAGYFMQEPRFAPSDVMPQLLSLEWARFSQAPDDAARQLLELVYEFFGLGPEALPPEFDAATGELRLSR